MAPKRKKTDSQLTTSNSDPQGMFSDMVVFLIENGVQRRRLQIWKQKLVQMGAKIEEKLHSGVSYVFAISSDALLQQIPKQCLHHFKGWLEESLRLGEKISKDLYDLKEALEKEKTPEKSLAADSVDGRLSSNDEMQQKMTKSCPGNSSEVSTKSGVDAEDNDLRGGISSPSHSESSHSSGLVNASPKSDATDYDVTSEHSSSIYKPPDLNKNITDIFGKLINIYRALGDDRRSFSYYKAIPVIEKLPFKVESVDQVKHLPSIGKSMEEHIQEIITTGKLSKLEHFEQDEKVRTISLFGEVWGIGPTTAMKLYEKGYRTLEDLKHEESLTHAQKLGLKYFDNIKQRILRHEVQEMEQLVQKAGEEVLPGGTDSGVDTYFGLCTYPGRELCHRIDFKVYPRDIYAYGLIAWTGNDVLNRRLRLLADSKGFRLDDTGLFPATKGSGGKRGSKGSASIKLYEEKDVFDFLGFPWLEPHERNL